MRVGQLIWAYRHAKELAGCKGFGIRAIARDIGISHGTLSRIERGEAMDGETLAKIMIWLFEVGVPAEEHQDEAA